jgi:hypothetical protein
VLLLLLLLFVLERMLLLLLLLLLLAPLLLLVLQCHGKLVLGVTQRRRSGAKHIPIPIRAAGVAASVRSRGQTTSRCGIT